MKYNLKISKIRSNQRHFLDILSDLIHEEITLSIEINEENQQTHNLIKELETANFINFDSFEKVHLNEFAPIIQNDQEVHQQLKLYVKQKLALQDDVQWLIDDRNIITDLNCKSIVEDFLHQLFYFKTIYQEYIEFLSQYPNMKILPIIQKKTLKGYKNVNHGQSEDYYIIYGQKDRNIENFNKFQQKIVKHEHRIQLFDFFTQYYIPIFKLWIQKHYFVYLEVVQDKEIINLYGPYPQVVEIEEQILKEYKSLNCSCSPIKSEGLTREQFEKLQLNEYLQQNSIINYENTLTDDPIKKDIDQMLTNIRKQTFQAVMFAQFEDKSIRDTLSSFNFEFNSELIEKQMEESAHKLALNNIKGVCVVYFLIVNGSVQYSILKKSISEYLKINSDQIYDPSLVKYINNMEFDELMAIEDDFKVSLDLKETKTLITGKQQNIEKFKERIANIASFKTEVVEFYQYKTNFNIRAAMIDFKEKYELILSQNACQVTASIENTRISIRGSQKNTNHFKSELQELEKEIEKSKIIKQIQIELPKEIKVKDLIRQLQEKHKSTDILLGECEGIHLLPLYEFRRKQTRIKICEGSPLGLFDVNVELLKLNSSLFIIPVEKVHNEALAPKYLWEQQIVKSRQLDLKSVTENKFYKMHKFIINLPNVNKNKKGKDKNNQQIDNITYSICYLYYKDYKKPQNFIDYFDKETLNLSIDMLLQEISKQLPQSIFISCSDEVPLQIIDFATQQSYPKFNIFFIMNEVETLEKLREDILSNFDEEENKKPKITQHFSIISCLIENVESVINDLHKV